MTFPSVLRNTKVWVECASLQTFRPAQAHIIGRFCSMGCRISTVWVSWSESSPNLSLCRGASLSRRYVSRYFPLLLEALWAIFVTILISHTRIRSDALMTRFLGLLCTITSFWKLRIVVGSWVLRLVGRQFDTTRRCYTRAFQLAWAASSLDAQHLKNRGQMNPMGLP